MKPKNSERPAARTRIADPETLLKAACSAPNVFNIAAYFRPLYVMREKGYSWRYLAGWLEKFNIDVSHVHLHRLYIKEDARLDKLTASELRKLGMPEEMIADRLSKDDPNRRLVAADPDDESSEDEKEEHR